MAESVHLLGYQCEFIDTVLHIFYCKKCTPVARRLTYTSSCGESYCHACIADIQLQDKPCPECGHLKRFHHEASQTSATNGLSQGEMQHKGEEVCLVRDVGSARCSLGPRPGQLPACGHQLSSQLLADHPQEQAGAERVHGVCEERQCVSVLSLQSLLWGDGGHTLASVYLLSPAVPQFLWGDLWAWCHGGSHEEMPSGEGGVWVQWCGVWWEVKTRGPGGAHQAEQPEASGHDCCYISQDEPETTTETTWTGGEAPGTGGEAAGEAPGTGGEATGTGGEAAGTGA